MRDRFLSGLIAVLITAFVVRVYEYGFDLSLFFALVAIYVTFFGLRREHTTVLKIRSCSTMSHHSLNAAPFNEFEIVVENQGVKLVDVAMTLTFASPTGHGTLAISLKEFTEKHGQFQQFERGMVAAFGWKSNALNEMDRWVLTQINNLAEQELKIAVFSQSYLAYVFVVYGPASRAKTWWNGKAQWLRDKLSRHYVKDGQPMIRIPKWIPMFPDIDFQIGNFVRWLKQNGRPAPESPAELA